jgi:hypothetical protein
MERSLTGKGLGLGRNGPWDMLSIIIDEGLIKRIRNWKPMHKHPQPDHLSIRSAFVVRRIQAVKIDHSLLIWFF